MKKTLVLLGLIITQLTIASEKPKCADIFKTSDYHQQEYIKSLKENIEQQFDESIGDVLVNNINIEVTNIASLSNGTEGNVYYKVSGSIKSGRKTFQVFTKYETLNYSIFDEDISGYCRLETKLRRFFFREDGKGFGANNEYKLNGVVHFEYSPPRSIYIKKAE